MYKLMLLSIFIIISFSQSAESEIKHMIKEYTKCFEMKDSNTFKNLFYSSKASILGFTSSRQMSRNPENRFDMLKMSDSLYQYSINHMSVNVYGKIATVNYDYKFMKDGQKAYEGSEILTFSNINGQWKIISVISSVENMNMQLMMRRS